MEYLQRQYLVYDPMNIAVYIKSGQSVFMTFILLHIQTCLSLIPRLEAKVADFFALKFPHSQN